MTVSEGGNGEIAAIERIRRFLPCPPAEEVWIGDDAAVVLGPGGEPLLLATDTVVENVHFELDLVDPADVGWKALAVNVSDIAAMGGRPLHAVVTVVGADGTMIDGLVRGIAEAAAVYKCAIVGGDLSSGPCLVVSIAVDGHHGRSTCGPALECPHRRHALRHWRSRAVGRGLEGTARPGASQRVRVRGRRREG